MYCGFFACLGVAQACTVVLLVSTVVLITIFQSHLEGFSYSTIRVIAVGLLLNYINFLGYNFRFTVQLPTRRQV